MKVKICGQTSVADCEMSLRCGADFLGVVVNVDWSARSRTVEEAAPIFEKFGDRTFLLTFNEPADENFIATVEKLNPYALQLTGQETPDDMAAVKEMTKKPVFKSIHLAPAGEGQDDHKSVIALMTKYQACGVDGFILDTATGGKFGGTGIKNDWTKAGVIAKSSSAPVFLAGGIDHKNVAAAIKTPGIYGVDLASGVEVAKGVKSEEKLIKLFGRIKQASK